MPFDFPADRSYCVRSFDGATITGFDRTDSAHPD